MQSALGGYQSVRELIMPGGRLYESRRAILSAVEQSRFLRLAPPPGAMYAFIEVDTGGAAPTSMTSASRSICSSRNTCWSPRASASTCPYRTHFRITNLPDSAILRTVFARIEEVLAGYAAAPRDSAEQKVVRVDKRFG